MFGINQKHLREIIIRPILTYFKLWSEESENLVIGTICKESLLGHFLKQNINGIDCSGPALGIAQMEPATHYDIWTRFLPNKPELRDEIISYFNIGVSIPDPTLLIYDLRYAALMCRIHYLRVKEKIPAANDIKELGRYWKAHYNTKNGAGNATEFYSAYKNLIL